MIWRSRASSCVVCIISQPSESLRCLDMTMHVLVSI